MRGVIALVGPTAVGKTDVSIELAKRLEAEIVGCDSMQVYRRMPILSQQPTAAQLAQVTHHVMNCVEPTDTFNVGQYRRLALEAIADIHARGKTALLVGGSGMYLKTLTHGFCEAPPEDAHIRTRLFLVAEEQGSPALHERLRSVDPAAASKIHPHDARRVVRALEVYESTGRPLSRLWSEAAEAAVPMTVLGLARGREALCARINDRVVRMMREDGVLDDARQVSALGLSRTARQVHGLRFLDAYLNGERSLEETITLWQQQVRQYARRQMTWFRADARIRWLTLDAHDSIQLVCDHLAGLLGTPTHRSPSWNAPSSS